MFCEAQKLGGQVLSLILSQMQSLINIAEVGDAEAVLLPFVLKCLACGHTKTQILTLVKLPLVDETVTQEKKFREVFTKLLPLLKDRHWELAQIACEYLSARVDKLDKDAQKQLFDHMCEPLVDCPNVVADYHIAIIQKIMERQEHSGPGLIPEEHFLLAFNKYLAKANCSTQGFDRVLSAVRAMITRLESRRSSLKEPVLQEIEVEKDGNMLHSMFSKAKITSPEIAEITGNAPHKVTEAERIEFKPSAVQQTKKPEFDKIEFKLGP